LAVIEPIRQRETFTSRLWTVPRRIPQKEPLEIIMGIIVGRSEEFLSV